MHSFTTRAASRLERSRQWCAITRAQHIEFDDDREASLRGGEFGALRLCTVSMGSHRVVQTAACDGASSVPALKFLFQEEGAAIVRQDGQVNRIGSGQWCALRKDRPFVIEAQAHSRQLALTIPCAELDATLSGTEWWRQGRSFLRGPAQILRASAEAAILAGNSLTMDDCRQLGQQFAMLARMTIRADDPGPPPDAREGRRRAVVDYINRNLPDEDLGVASIARAFDMSPRSLHKLFEGEARTLSRLIWDLRLERCREQMADPCFAKLSITHIVHFWGFADSQHFSRAFRQRYGLSPRDYRNLHILQ